MQNNPHDTDENRHRLRRGPSSFTMQDPEVVFHELKLKEGDTFFDLGCGPGEYSLKASSIVGNSGIVYAMDTWQSMIDGLIEETNAHNITNIKALVSDITGPLPIDDDSIHVCLIATVLHIPAVKKKMKEMFSEARRVLLPAGRLAIINLKKEEMPFGPPIHLRLSPQETEQAVTECGFEKVGFTDLGYNYLMQFCVETKDHEDL